MLLFVAITVEPQTDGVHIRMLKHRAIHCELTKMDAAQYPYRVITLANSMTILLYFTQCFTFYQVLSLCSWAISASLLSREGQTVSSQFFKGKGLMKLQGFENLSGRCCQAWVLICLTNPDLLDSAIYKDRFTMGFTWRGQVIPGQHLALHITLILLLPYPMFTAPLTQI